MTATKGLAGGGQVPLWRLAPYGAFGAVLPAVSSLMYRSDAFAFSPEPRVIAGQALYVLAAALLSAIFPYGRHARPFNAAVVGICFPTIVGTALGAARAAVPALSRGTGGTEGWSIVHKIIDAFALF
jgi:hypothetical protein